MRIVGKIQFIIFFVILFLSNQISEYILYIIFAFFHEMGHIIIAILCGRKIEKLYLMPMGFSVEFKIIVEDYNKKVLKGNMSNIKNIIITIAGPFVNFFIAVFIWVLKQRILNWCNLELIINVIYINLVIGIFNLLPILPLDGGGIIKEILCILFGKRKALEQINNISNMTLIILTIISSMLLVMLKNLAIFFIIIFLWILTIKENTKYKALKRLYILMDKYK